MRDFLFSTAPLMEQTLSCPRRAPAVDLDRRTRLFGGESDCLAGTGRPVLAWILFRPNYRS